MDLHLTGLFLMILAEMPTKDDFLDKNKLWNIFEYMEFRSYRKLLVWLKRIY
jgi:hypothetical protein